MNHSIPIIYHVAAARDALNINLRPASIVTDQGAVLSIVPPSQAPEQVFPHAKHVFLPNALALPLMVNAHAHLDLTTSGPTAWVGNPDQFDQWLWQVMQKRRDAQDIRTSVLAGLKASQMAGVGFIGDIASSTTAIDALKHTTTNCQVISFLECFGQGLRQAQAIASLCEQYQQAIALNDNSTSCLGLQPHAPYSAGQQVYQAAIDLSKKINPLHPRRLTTHLAETLMEDQFIRYGSGPLVDLLKRIGKWDSSIIAHNQSPVQYLAPILQQARWLVAHCNYVDDHDIALLAQTGTTVAYCPIASSYFGHPHHRYLDMIKNGVNVCLGTDSILCQPVDEPSPMGILPQMRFLFQRDGTDPATLLAMATVNGARGLVLDPKVVSLQPGAPARLATVTFDPHDPIDALTQVLGNHHPMVPLAADE